MRAGRLTEQIEVLTPIVIINEFGSQQTKYVHKFSTRAERVRVNGGRTIENQDMFYADLKNFSIRRYHPIEDFDIVVYRGKRYRILDIEYKKEEQRKVISCEKINE